MTRVRTWSRTVGIAIVGAALLGSGVGVAAPATAVRTTTTATSPAVIANGANAGSVNALRSLDVPVDADVTVGPDLTTSAAADPVLSVDASPVRVTYLRFDLGATQRPLVSAVLHLHVATASPSVPNPGSSSGGRAEGVGDDTWSETSVGWLTRPPVDGPLGDIVGAVGADQWVSYDVTRLARGSGSATIALSSTSADGIHFDSAEAGHDAPYLTLQLGWATRRGPDSVVVAAVGDMACSPTDTVTETACQARAVSDAIVHDPEIATLLALGDLQYPGGALSDFLGGYDPTYGRLRDITVATPGNHEYGTSGAAGYFTYFGSAAGNPEQGWTSGDIGSTWHVVALNSNCAVVSCVAGSPQERWFRADLAATQRPCTIVIWHHPRFSSGVHGNDPAVTPLWQAAEDARVELVLSGHDHTYERFAPQTAHGTSSPTAPREFVVGTGGRSQYTFTGAAPGSEVRIDDEFGFLRLTLDPSSYAWEFIAADGRVLDHGTDTCRA